MKIRKGKLVTVEGMKELKKVLKKIPQELRGEPIMKALRAGAEPIRRAASDKAPRRSGKLADNIVVADIKRRPLAVRVSPTREVAYGVPQEYGSRYHPAQPFFRPAFDEQKGEATKVIAKELGMEIEKFNDRN